MPNAEDWKFRPPGYSAERIIESRELWFSTPENFNDPFDCQVDIQGTFASIREGIRLHHGEQMAQLIDEAARRATQHRYGYFCTCGAWDETLMWSHYADSHKGLALGFSFSNEGTFHSGELKYKQADYRSIALREAISKANDALNMFRAYPRQYPGLMPGEADQFFENFKCNINELYEAVRFMKAECWRYEKERRYEIELSPAHGKGVVRAFDSTDLKHVIFGVLCEEKTIERIRALLKDVEWSHVQFWRAARDAVNLKVVAEPLG